jgi:sugar lactone lactonase YvrE
MHFSHLPSLIPLFITIPHVGAQATDTPPLAAYCHPNTTTVVCIASHAAVLPEPFLRPTSRNGTVSPLDAFQSTSVPSSPTFNLTHSAHFLLFNPTIGLSLLGPNPTYTQLFTLSPHVHEAPVYIPPQNRIIFSEFAYGATSAFQVNLNTTPPTLSAYQPATPVLGINGGTLHAGLVYWAISGSKSFFLNNTLIPGLAPGIYALDPTTGHVSPIVNNYHGTQLNSPNDLVFSRSSGDLFFTDALYGFQQNITLHPPALPASVYRFRPSTGELQIIESTLVQPNGIAFSPDEETLYVGDSGAGYSTIDLPEGEVPPPLQYNATGPRTVYAYDVRETPGGKVGLNRRAIYLAQELVPDGLKVSREGYVLVAAGSGSVFFTLPSFRRPMPF